MRLTLRIFRKDVERLWPAILPALALLACWTFGDARVYVSMRTITNPAGSWLNLALPFVWSLLAALAVVQDSLAGDRQFWVALPCGWKPLLAAKAIFIAAFIHLPYFLATAVILLARGFDPMAHLPHLFWKQTVLLALTLPALAASTLVKNLAHFALLVIGAASAVVLLSGRINAASRTETIWDVRWPLALIVLVTGSLAVVALQFIRRATTSSRVIGAISVLAALSVYNWLPRDASAAIFAAVSPAPESRIGAGIQVGSQAPDRSTRQFYFNDRATTVLIPIVISGGPGGQFELDQIGLKVVTSNGESHEAAGQGSPDAVSRERIRGNLFQASAASPIWQSLVFGNPLVWNQIRREPVTIRAHAVIEYREPGKSVTVTAGPERNIGGLARCSAASFPDTVFASLWEASIVCESPELASRDLSVGFLHPGYVSPWGHLAEHRFFGLDPYPQDPWLSPLHRGSFFVQGSAPETWVVTPQARRGAAVIDYSISGIDLNRFVVQRPAKQEDAK